MSTSDQLAQSALIVLSGSANAGTFDVAKGDAIFMQTDHVEIHAGPIGMVALAAYTGGAPAPNLLRRVIHATAAPTNAHLEAIK